MLIGNLLKNSELSILKMCLNNSHLIFSTEYFIFNFRIWDNFVVFSKKGAVSFPMVAFQASLRLPQLYTCCKPPCCSSVWGFIMIVLFPN